MAEHSLLYILELDGHAKPDDLNAVSLWFKLFSISFFFFLLGRCCILPACISMCDSYFFFLISQ